LFRRPGGLPGAAWPAPAPPLASRSARNLNARQALALVLIAAALVLGGAGISTFVTERGVANDIKGFVLLLIGVVLLVGGCILWELAAIRRTLERKDAR
jgi:hypothetical protein